MRDSEPQGIDIAWIGIYTRLVRVFDSRISSDWRPAIYVSIFVFVLFWTLTILPLRLPRPQMMSDVGLPPKGDTFRQPIVPRVLVIIIDGLGTNAALHPKWMPRFVKLARKGAFGVAQASFPTMTTPGLTSIATGRLPPPGMGFPGMHSAQPQYDSVLFRASAAGLRAFAVGQHDWEALYGAHGAKLAVIPYGNGPINYDSRLLPIGMNIMHGKQGPWNLLFLHLFDLDMTGHRFGMNSPEYRAKLDWLDSRIESIAAAAGPDATVIVTADHGQTENGTHGGIEPEVRNIPLVFLGNKVRKGRFDTVPQQDIAATISALLGLPQPALSVGRPILDALKLTSRQRAEIWMDVLDQRKREWFAAREHWPWWEGDPRSQLRQARDLYHKGRFRQSETIARKAAIRIDGSLASLSPKVWFGRIILALWLVTLAACFSLAWPDVPAIFLRVASGLGAVGLLVLLLPSFSVSLWPLASGLAVLVAGGLMSLSLYQGTRNAARIGRLEWAAWWVALASFACPVVVDVVLWSWLTVWAFCVTGAWKSFRARSGLAASALCLAALAGATFITSWTPSVESSVLRSLLPQINLRWLGTPSWTAIELCLWPIVAAFAFLRLRSLPESGRRLALYGCGLLLIVGSYVDVRFEQELSGWLAVIALASIVLLVMKPTSMKIYGYWLSLLGLIFCHSILAPRDFCFLFLATLTGWGLQAADAPQGEFWQAVQVLALCFWTFVAADGHLTLSRISVTEFGEVLGYHWPRHLMAALSLLRQTAIAITPVLPLLSSMQWRKMLGLFPFLGALSGGSLIILWVQQFFIASNPAPLGEDPNFVMMLWAIFFGWGIMLAWAVVHGTYRFAQRLSGRDAARV